MGKLRKVEPDSPLANSAFFRRKEYDLSWQTTFNSARKQKRQKNTPWKLGAETMRDITNDNSKSRFGRSEFKPRVSKEEMEEMGCEPIGILAKKCAAKINRDSENRQLSFSYETLDNEKTPKRGTPLTQRCVVEMGRNQNKELEDLEDTVAKIEKSVRKGIMTIEEALIDIEGLKFRRQANSSAKFFQLEMQLRKQKGDFLEACVACVRGAFAAKDKRSRARLIEELNQILKSIEKAGDSDSEPDSGPNNEDAGDESLTAVDECDENTGVSPKSNYTPESIETIPNVRNGSAAKTRLRFTPLVSGCQRLSSSSKVVKKKRGSFKLTPLRRSTRVAASRSSQRLSSSYMAINL